MRFEFAKASDAGLVRSNNEDSVVWDGEQGVAVLADGMGGYNAGEIASAMAVTLVRDELVRTLRTMTARPRAEHTRRALETCVHHANTAIFNAAQSHTPFSGMGTTLVAGIFRSERVTLGHVGDSRCYLWRRGVLTQLTKDHSLLQAQMDAGSISPAEARLSVQKNLVTRALGVEASVQVDIQEHRPMAGDLYLMCSDGLTDMVDDPAIAQTLHGAQPLPDKAKTLIQQANAAGGRDNIAVLLALAQEKTGAARMFPWLFRKTP